MNKACLTRVSEARNHAMRPSSVRRLCKLRELVAEFAGRDIGPTGIALLLGCSLTAARNYVAELVDAGVVVPHPVPPAAGVTDRRLYRRTENPLAVHRYLAALAQASGEGGGEAQEWDDAGANAPVRDVARIHRNWLAADFSPAAPARRDPLVAALFGAARLA